MQLIAANVPHSMVCACFIACVCVLATLLSCAKMAEPFEMPFGGRLV